MCRFVSALAAANAIGSYQADVTVVGVTLVPLFVWYWGGLHLLPSIAMPLRALRWGLK